MDVGWGPDYSYQPEFRREQGRSCKSPRLSRSPRNATSLSMQLVDVANGLHYLHLCDVIHGDLKGVNASSLPILVVVLIDSYS